MCRVIVDEGLVDEGFVLEQTDLPLLVDPATNRFLRQSDIEEGGSDEQFYAADSKTGEIMPAPRGNLSWGVNVPALEGTFSVKTRSGPLTLTTVFELIRRRLVDYTPERAAEITGVHPQTIRDLARKVASKKTNIIGSLGNGKYYHGDLVERAEILLLALSGNWGKQGTGVRGWTSGLFDGTLTVAAKGKPGPDDVLAMLDSREKGYEARLAADPTLTRAIDAIAQAKAVTVRGAGGMNPPMFFWYNHAGYRDAWQRAAWHDPAMKRPFDDYFQEAVDKGWWTGVDYPRPGQTPRVLVECGGNVIRRTRGGGRMLLEHLGLGSSSS